MTDPLVSITVCVRNGVDWIEDCLHSLRAQTHPSVEILVVNDGSSDGAESVLDPFHDPDGEHGVPLRVHHQPPLGLSAGRQWALEHAKGDWVAITDIDVRPEPDWIANLIAASSPLAADEQVVAVTGRTVFEQANDLVSRLRSVEISAKYRSRSRRTSLANGPCSMFKRAALLEVGGFDPMWYHAEDMEVSLRLLEAGGVIVYAPNAIVRHVPETGAAHFLAKRRRDARAHVRIVRHYPRRRRQGPGFDFLGSSVMVLTLFPIWLAIFVTGCPFLLGVFQGEITDASVAMDDWRGIGLFASFCLLSLHELFLWWGSLGVVNREVMKSAKGSKIIAMLGVRQLTLRWSIALWQGLLLGLLDAALKRNGHR
ncbi:MAG: glycosyltransferase family 2 protein [Candidatus Poseidonia sp.]|jgi:cellulose synthase/poly-beta-1,6-N-acetylglucosamine synthase-like glycosyltransferase|nr:glycosyltransferase family 2 protein [Poseidonia sp.]